MEKNAFLLNITHRSKSKAIDLLTRSGYKKPLNASQMYKMLAHYLRKKQNKAVLELSKIHPDAKIIIEAYKAWNDKSIGADGETSTITIEEPKATQEKFAGCNGCPSTVTKSAEGDTQKPNMSTILIVSGAAILSIALISLVAMAVSKSNK